MTIGLMTTQFHEYIVSNPAQCFIKWNYICDHFEQF